MCSPIECDSNDVSHIAILPSNGERPSGHGGLSNARATNPMNTKSSLKVHSFSSVDSEVQTEQSKEHSSR